MKAVFVLLFCTFIFSVLSFAQAEDTQVVFALKHQNVKAAEDLLFNEISNNLHSNYGKYLSQKQIGELVGPSDKAFAFVYEWVSSVGARDVEVSPSNDWITFYVSEESAKALLKEEKLFETSQSPLNAYLDIFRVFYKGTLPRVSTKTSSEKSWMDFSILQDIENEIDQEKVIPHFSTFRTSSNSVHFVVIPQFVTKQQIKLYNHPTAISQITIASSSPRNRAVRTELQFQPNEESTFQCAKCDTISKSTLFEAIQMNQYCSSLHPSQLICFSKAIEVEDLLPFAAQKISKKSDILLTFSVKLSFFDDIETPFVTLNNEIENRNHLSTISIRFAAPQMDPNTQRSIYGINSTLVGTNANNKQMVWGTGSYGISLTDMASFYSDFDVDSTTSHVQVLGQAGDPTGSNWVEATLDAQYISSIAPQVQTTCFNTDNNTNAEASTGFGDALLYFALGMTLDPSPPLIISMSLGSLSYDSCNILCTQVDQLGVATYDYCTNFVQNQYQTCMYSSASLVSRINEEFMLMGLRGISLFGAAGDGGNHFSFGAFIAIGENATLAKTLNQISCNYSMPTFPAASPYVTAVGGLQMQPSNTTPGEYYPIGCSSQTGGDITGGCGFSWQFAMPAYQQSFVQNYLNSLPSGTQLGLYNASGRAYPDFSGIASEVPIVCNGKTEIVYGTSCSTPEVAGLFSLINDHRLNNNLPSLGFINTRLYSSAGTQASNMFVDATEGISSCGTDICCNNGFPATVGWDSFTGFGNPSFSGLLAVFGTDN